MPIAAVPSYLGQDFSSASPGLRFGMYLPLWSNSFALLKEQKTEALKRATKLTKDDQKILNALLKRQKENTQGMGGVFTLDAIATAPFTTGLGNEHPLENGFAFLNPYGLPYLPGSGVKGVLRQAARELAGGDWGDTQGWSTDKLSPQQRKSKVDIDLSVIDALFGLESEGGDSDHVRGALSFWDAIPQIPGDSLAVDVMTPHQSHYYQQRKDRKSGDSTSPHDSGAPNPISFLTLPPGTGFAFHVRCDQAYLTRLAPDLAHEDRWQTLLTAAFEHAFEWLGFGAKTAVGYGAMEVDRAAQNRQREAAEKQRKKEQDALEKQQRDQALASMSPVDREIEKCLDERTDKNLGDIPALMTALKKDRWNGELKREVAQKLRERMQTEKGKWKETTAAKKPEKDSDYQNTLLVKRWIDGA